MTVTDRPKGIAAVRSTLLDVHAMSERLAPLLDGVDELAGETRITAARVVDGGRDDRAVIEYDVGARSPSLIGKVYADGDRARRLHDLLVAMAATALAAGDFRAPRPVAYFADLGTVVYVAAPGRSLDALPVAEHVERVAAAASWLATMHASGIDLDRRLDLGTETRNVGVWADLVVRAYPATAQAATALTERIETLAAAADHRVTLPIHKDYHYQHTLFDGPRLTVIDFDEARMGDPSFDVAHFTANLRLLGLREESAGRAQGLEDAFLAAYAARTGYPLDARHELWHAYTCVKIAKQLVSGRGPTPVPEGAVRRRQVEEILREGVRGAR